MSIATAPPDTPASLEPAHEAGSLAQDAAEPTRVRGLRLAHLWAIVPFAIAWFVHSIDFIEPFDFWWNVKSGQIMTQTGRFLGQDVLVWTPVREPYSNPQWGSQLLLYWLYEASPYLLLTARTLIIAATLGFILWLCFWRTNALRAASIATLIAYFTGWTNYGMRPQLLAFLPFIAYLFLLERKDAYPKWLVLLTPIMLFWVNVHGSFFLGAALLGIYALGTVLEKLPTVEGRRWLTSKSALWQAGCFTAAALATLANPYAAGIYNYFFVATNDPIARALNIEWQAPTIYDGTGILFYSNVVIFAASLYISRRRLRPTEILLVAAFGYLSLTSLRNVIWWGWVTAPMLATNFAEIGAMRAARRAERAALAGPPQAPSAEAGAQAPRRAELPALNWVIAVMLLGGAFIFTPLWRPANPLVPEKSKPTLAADTPVEITRFVAQSRPPAPLFNYMEWGGYMEWELYPQYKMFIDGRFEARQVQVWKDYLSVSRARTDWQDTLRRYGVNTLVLNKEFHTDLIRTVRQEGGWQKAYEDKMGVVFTRAR
jgi:hypothetical protein